MTLECGQEEVILAGGVEHMHHVPIAECVNYNSSLFDNREFHFTNMGLTAEKIAGIYDISRREQDEFALLSHNRAVTAIESGHFGKEIVPILTPAGLVSTDQGPRKNSTLEILASMKPAFKENGTVTGANSSPLSDGASLVLLASKILVQHTVSESGLRWSIFPRSGSTLVSWEWARFTLSGNF